MERGREGRHWPQIVPPSLSWIGLSTTGLPCPDTKIALVPIMPKLCLWYVPLMRLMRGSLSQLDRNGRDPFQAWELTPCCGGAGPTTVNFALGGEVWCSSVLSACIRTSNLA